LRAVRQSAQLSQKQPAAKLGLSQNRLSELQTDPGSMRVHQLLAVLSSLGLELQAQTRGGPPVAGSVGSAGSADQPTAGKVDVVSSGGVQRALTRVNAHSPGFLGSAAQ